MFADFCVYGVFESFLNKLRAFFVMFSFMKTVSIKMYFSPSNSDIVVTWCSEIDFLHDINNLHPVYFLWLFSFLHIR